MSSTVEEKLGYAEVEARKRKERLRQLKRKAQGETTEKEKQEDELEDDTAISQAEDPPEETNMETKHQIDELDLSNLAPRKIDWDLKRGIARSLEILQDRTNDVISEIIRERLESNDMD